MAQALLGCTECGAHLARREEGGAIVIYTGCWDGGTFLQEFSVEPAEKTGRTRLTVRCPTCGTAVEWITEQYGFQSGTPNAPR
jgi:endogenous inhibitor of DNA gyrase (YacG/DUF329 family)